MEGIIGEIRLFAGNFAPKSWAFCAGQIINIASNTALFSILGTTYGGNGTTNFALPDLRGRGAVGAGQGPGLSPYSLGEATGEETHTLSMGELPAHNHNGTVMASGDAPNSTNPTFNYLSQGSRSVALPAIYAPASSPAAVMAGSATRVNIAGDSNPHNNMQPFLALNYIICQYGVFPPRN